MRERTMWLMGAVAFAVVSGCDSEDVSALRRSVPDPAGDGADVGPGTPPPDDPGSSPLRRLSKFQLENTVEDLLGDGARAAVKDFPAEDTESFDTLANAQLFGKLHAERTLPIAESLAKLALPRAPKCDAAASGGDICARRTVEQFGKRLFRRPVERTEADRFVATYAAVKATATHEVGMEWMLVAMFLSPRFLYLRDRGDQVVGDNVKLTSYDVASRLSYFLWQSTPDDDLLGAADRNELQEGTKVAAQVERMMKHPRARASVAHFHEQWLELAKFGDTVKDETIFPTFVGVRGAMAEEGRLFLDAAFWGEGTLSALFTAPYTFVDASLATFYNLPAPAGPGFQKVAFDPAQRGGFLTQGFVLAGISHPDQTSTTLRGKFIRTKVLCRPIEPPPGDFPLDALGPASNPRERGDKLATNACSRGCHSKMDPIGFAFENFDAVGRWRTVDNGQPVNANGEIIDVDPSVDGKVNGAVDLGKRLAASEAAKGCLTTQWFRYGVGRATEGNDAKTLEWILAQAKTGDDLALRSVVTSITRSASLRLRRNEVAQ